MNKTKKILSIILISLLILSTVFTLMKKVGLCASSSQTNDNISFPLKIGNGYGRSFSFSSSDGEYVAQYIKDWDTNWTWSQVDLIILDEYNDSTGIATFFCYNRFQVTFSPNAESFFIDSSSIQFTTTGDAPYWNAIAVVDYNVNSHSCSNPHWLDFSGNVRLTKQTTASTWFDFLGNNTYQFKHNTDLYCYPMWVRDIGSLSGYFTFGDYSGTDSPGFNHYFWDNYQDSIYDVDHNNNIWKPNYQNPSNQQGFWDNVTDFFNRSFKSLLGGISGATKTIGDYFEQFYNGSMDFWSRTIDTILGWLSGLKDDSDDISEDTSDISGSVSSIDSRLSSFFGSFWSNFSDKLEDFLEDSWGHLPDIMKAPYRIAHWFYQHGLNNGEFDFITLWHYLFDFDFTAALNSFSNNKYGDFILDIRDFFNTFFGSISDQTASSRVFFVIPIGSHFGSDVGDVEINFDWYTSIRDNYLPYFMAFLYISVIWLFFKRLPDILRGVAGAESSFTDALPYDTHSTTYNGVGVFTSDTHVSNGGRIRVTYNSFKKL